MLHCSAGYSAIEGLLHAAVSRWYSSGPAGTDWVDTLYVFPGPNESIHCRLTT
jgi:hypothetical protein